MREIPWRHALACVIVLEGLCFARSAWAEVSYRDGLRVTGSGGGMGLHLFVRPRYEYVSDDGGGIDRSSMEINLLGARLRAWDRRGILRAQVMGGMAVDEPILLDTFVEVRPARWLGLRFGQLKVGFDEQTAHRPFWLRMTRSSRDVQALSYGYDLGVALLGSALDDGLSYSVSVTNGEPPSLENANIDFLYAGRLALRLGRFLRWRRADLVIGLGTAWTLEPWMPEPGVSVNRSVFTETIDVSARIRAFTATAALLYRLMDPGAYGETSQALGWHFEAGMFVAEPLEVAVQVAHLIPELGGSSGPGEVEAAVALNAFPDSGRMRVQLEYAYLVVLAEEGVERDAHRVVVQWQALY